jgi:hypothetical protein
MPTPATKESPPASESSDAIASTRAQIEHTRREMGDTIDEIRARLDPHAVMEDTRERLREATVGRIEPTMRRAQAAASDLAERAKQEA